MRCNYLQILQVRPTMAASPGEPPPVKHIHAFACCRGACHTPLILQYPAYVRFRKHTSHAEKTSSLSKRSSSGERGSVYLVPATQIFNTRHRASTGPPETTQLDQTFGSLGCPPDRCWPLIRIEQPCSRAVTLPNVLLLRRHTTIPKMRPSFRIRAC